MSLGTRSPASRYFFASSPRRGLLADIRAEEVPGGDVRNAQLLGQQDGLGALAGTGRTEQNKSHLRNPS